MGHIENYLGLRIKPPESQSPYFELADDCIENAAVLVEMLSCTASKSADLSNYRAVAAYHLFKVTDCLISVAMLLKYGMIENAKIIARTSVELAINLKFLSMDAEHRSSQFLMHSAISLYRDYKTMRLQVEKEQSDSLATTIPYSQHVVDWYVKHGTEIAEGYERAKSLYGTNERGEIPGKFSKDWAGMSLRDMAVESKLLLLYQYPYRLYCNATHATPSDLHRYVNLNELKIGFSQEVEDCPSVLWTTCSAHFLCVEIVATAFGQDMKARNEKVDQRLRDLYEEMQ